MRWVSFVPAWARSFTATSRCRRTSVARYTSPMPPRASKPDNAIRSDQGPDVEQRVVLGEIARTERESRNFKKARQSRARRRQVVSLSTRSG